MLYLSHFALHLHKENRFSQVQLNFFVYKNIAATCFAFVQTIIRLHSKLRDNIQHVQNQHIKKIKCRSLLHFGTDL